MTKGSVWNDQASTTTQGARALCNLVGMCVVILSAILTVTGTSPVRAATINLSASATIVSPVAMGQPSDMRFSGFVSGTTPGTITLIVPTALPQRAPTSADPVTGGGRLGDGGVELVRGTDCATQRNCGVGALQISGPKSSSFSGVSTPATTTLTSGDNTMTLERIELRYGANGTTGAVSGAGILNGDGNGTVIVGGVLNVAAGQPVGTYTGALIVSVDY